MAIVGFIPEIIWHSEIKITPLERIYDSLLECLDDELLRCRDHAYPGAKAVLHMIIQRKCLGGPADAAVFYSVAVRHLGMGHWRYAGDSDLESTLGLIDCVLGVGAQTLQWETLKFMAPHHSWIER